MRFSEVIGHDPIKEQLTGLVRQNRLSHALLLPGKEGSGALPLGLALAQYLVCEKVGQTANRQQTGLAPALFADRLPETPDSAEILPADSCGSCPSCYKAAGLIHPDIHFSYPVVPSKPGDKPLSTDYITQWREFVRQYPYGNAYDWLQFIGAENKQGNITADECNDILKKLNLKSFESGYKILIMWMPEYLGKEGNKLLKLIEEPPQDTLFILIPEDESKILPTIVSRTQVVRIPLYETSEIEAALVIRAGLARESAIPLANLAEGNYREALQLIQHAGEDWQSLVRDWLNAMLKSSPVAQVKWVDEVSKMGREKQKQLLRYFNHLMEESIQLRILGDQTGHMPDKERDFAMRINKLATVSQMEAMIRETDHAAYYIERNANSKMLFLALSIKIYHIIKDNSLILIN
jgi:DNA polymerase-3 subunit delta'